MVLAIGNKGVSMYEILQCKILTHGGNIILQLHTESSFCRLLFDGLNLVDAMITAITMDTMKPEVVHGLTRFNDN